MHVQLVVWIFHDIRNQEEQMGIDWTKNRNLEQGITSLKKP